MLLSIESPVVMGILNVTPDSFYDGGKYTRQQDILKHVEIMLQQGATIIDIGAQSTRPNAGLVTEEEELARIVPAVEWIHKEFPDAILSADTFRSRVAEESIQSGISMINDISAGEDPLMFSIAAKHKTPLIIMNRSGDFNSMHQPGNYVNFLSDIVDFFTAKIKQATDLGIYDIIVDPGFGFSKTILQNYSLLKNFKVLEMLDKPLLAGLSRKSMLYKPVNSTAEIALNLTTAANMIALQNGASILRVHDVKAAMECISVYEQIK